MTILVSIETVLLVLLSLLVAGMLRTHGEILRALKLGPEEGDDAVMDTSPPPGPPANVDDRLRAPAPDIIGTDLALEELSVGMQGFQNTLLGFLSSGCLACVRFWEAVSEPDNGLDLPLGARMIFVTKDVQEERLAQLRDLAPAAYPVVMSSQAWQNYEVPGAPYFVWIDGPTATIRGVGSSDKIEGVLNMLRDQLAEERLPDASPDRDERELLAAGITPGHPSLFGLADDGGAKDGNILP